MNFATAQEAYEDYVRSSTRENFMENFNQWKAKIMSDEQRDFGKIEQSFEKAAKDAEWWAAVIEEEVERWWSDHFPGSPLSQNTFHLNYVRQSLDVLKERLKKL